ncbi:MAG: hypothetical protein KC413_23865 [Anaerolineales bacterium]|nr:hypothetical protein [Anaerolineales bacterium]
MFWFRQHARYWRIIILVLLAITFIGPWGYDLLDVPAPYDCSGSSFRVNDDFCGMPLPGVWAVLTSFGLVFVTLLQGDSSATFSILLIRVLFGLFILVTPLPIFSSLFLLAPGENPWRVVRHVKVWVLAVVGGMDGFLGFSLMRGLPPLPVWGLWAYVVLAPLALLMEVVLLVGGRRVGE